MRMSNLSEATKEIHSRFNGMTYEELHKKYYFLDQNKFFEVYENDVYLHFFGLSGIIEFSIKNNQIIEFLADYLEEVRMKNE